MQMIVPGKADLELACLQVYLDEGLKDFIVAATKNYGKVEGDIPQGLMDC